MVKMLEVKNKTKNTVVSMKTGLANEMMERIVGLMFKKDISFDGLYIKPCNSIHTFFCKFPLDIYFLDKKNKVIRIIKNMKPWDMTRVYFGSRSVLEFKSGVLDQEIELNDELEVKCIN